MASLSAPNSKVKGNMMSIKDLVGKRMTKDAKFMGTEVKINKLSVSEIIEIQDLAKDAEGDEKRSFEVMRKVICLGVDGGVELSDQDFDNFPMDELSSLSSAIMKFSGLGETAGK